MRPSHRTSAMLGQLMLVIAFGFMVGAVSQAQTLSSGTSGRQFRKQAVESLPYGELNEATKSKLAPVLEKPSIYRRLPITAIATDPDYYRFLIRQPEVVVAIWKLMGVTEMDVNRTGPFELDSNDGAGTVSRIELVYGNENTHIFYAEGTYEGPVLRRKLNGRCVLVLRTQHTVDAKQKPKATCQLDIFLKVDNTTVGVVAKTLQPLVGSTADHNFTESLRFLERLNETTERNGGGVQNMAERLEISPDVRKRFQQAAAVCFQRSQPSTGRSSATTPSRPSLSSAQPTARQATNQANSYLQSQSANYQPANRPVNNQQSVLQQSTNVRANFSSPTRGANSGQFQNRQYR